MLPALKLYIVNLNILKNDMKFEKILCKLIHSFYGVDKADRNEYLNALNLATDFSVAVALPSIESSKFFKTASVVLALLFIETNSSERLLDCFEK